MKCLLYLEASENPSPAPILIPLRALAPTPKLCCRRRSSVVASVALCPAPLPAGPVGPFSAGRRRSERPPRLPRLPPPLRGGGIVLPPAPPPPPPARSPRLWHPQRTFSPRFALSSHRRSSFSGKTINKKGPRLRLLLEFLFFICSLEMLKGSHEEQARRPRTLESRRSHRTHIGTPPRANPWAGLLRVFPQPHWSHSRKDTETAQDAVSPCCCWCTLMAHAQLADHYNLQEFFSRTACNQSIHSL
ncbi:uncharacterized protein [Pithys albifrons albifrons]|uniref:uncharacterized protein isoform X3 n=1 Tax=Pithys albifrons albifrons TaxID=3385563 RepID=UPI003A5CC2BD